MNYIRQLNAFFYHIGVDKRLTPGHIALYFALFHYWNLNRFKIPFEVVREDLMILSRVGSKNTYHKYIKDLQNFGYLIYEPGSKRFFKCKVHLRILNQESVGLLIDTESVSKLTPDDTTFDTGTVPDLIPLLKQNINISKSVLTNIPNLPHNRNLKYPSLNTVKLYFKNNHYPEQEALKFFHYNEGMGWLIGGKPIRHWTSFAHKWMLNTCRNDDHSKITFKKTNNDHNSYLHFPPDQKYSEPL